MARGAADQKNGLKAISAIVVLAMKNSLVHLIRRVQLGPVLRRERHIGQYIGLGLVEEAGELGQLGAELVGTLAPLRLGRLGIVLGKGGGDEGGDDASPAFAGMGQRVAHEVQARQRCQVALSTLARVALMPSWASETSSLTPRRPRRASLRRNAVQNVSASEGPMSMPSTSRRPSLLTPTATITAIDRMRPFWRTFT